MAMSCFMQMFAHTSLKVEPLVVVGDSWRHECALSTRSATASDEWVI